MSNLGLCEFREVSMDGKTTHFRTGLPVTFPFIRNTASMPKWKKGTPDTYGQKVEPAGRYMLHATNSHLNPGWIRGSVSFQNPIVLSYGNTTGDAFGWKSRLSKEFGGKVGKALTAKLRALGYDGVVTGGRHGTDEIVDLNPIRNPKKRMGKILKFPKRRIAKKPSSPRRNPAITLTGPQIREILIWEGGGGQVTDARIGLPLKAKGLVKPEKASTTHRGWTKSKIIYSSTDLGNKVSKLLHSRTDLPSWRSQVDWSKISVTISEK